MNLKAYRFQWKHLEGYIWLIAITLLALTNPEGSHHFSLCVFKNLGIDFCPGCGLGHSISMLFRLRIFESFQTHPLGIVALFFLLRRCYQIFFVSNINLNTKQNEQSISSNA